MGCQWSSQLRKRRLYQVSDPAVPDADVEVQRASAAGQDPKRGAKAHKETKSAVVQEQPGSPVVEQLKPTVPAAKQKPDPKDFICINLISTTCVKAPGCIDGQQFVIDNCQDCDLYVMDHCAMVTIDDCKNCRIFIGPTESSIFVRDCTNCKFACITRQLRTRDCIFCDFLLMTRTRPIIESSSGLSFGCYATPYQALAQQLAAAKLSSFHNFWSDVYDFTPPLQGQDCNWKLLPLGVTIEHLLGPIPAYVRQLMLLGRVSSPPLAGAAEAVQLAAGTSVPDGPSIAAAAASLQDSNDNELDRLSVMHTHGQSQCQQQQQKAEQEGCFAFVLFPPGKHASVQKWVYEQFSCTAQPAAPSSEADGVPAVTPPAADSAVANAAAQGASKDAVAAADHAGSGQQPLQEQRAVLLHTNEAVVNAAVAKEMARFAAWDKSQLKKLLVAAASGDFTATGSAQAACCIGLEVCCSSQAQQAALCTAAEQMGALTCSSVPAAKVFRNLGTDG